MIIEAVTIRIHIPWVHSLKEKRQILKSLVTRIRQKFNCSIAEVDSQDHHQDIVLGIVCVTNVTAQADRIIEQIISFLEDNTEGELFILEREFR